LTKCHHVLDGWTVRFFGGGDAIEPKLEIIISETIVTSKVSKQFRHWPINQAITVVD